MTPRSFLFLQGPHGFFFPRLGAALRAQGHAVHRINLNGGDWASWPDGGRYCGTAQRWPAYLGDMLAAHGVTDLVLFGDGRPPHAAAIKVARAAGVRVRVFEEGYVRPDWVTLEDGGVNGHSALPRDPVWFRAQAATLPPLPSHPPLAPYGGARNWAAFFYHAQNVLQRWRFPFQRTHRTSNPVWEGITHLRRFRRRAAEELRCRSANDRLAGHDYFLFPLQLTSDYQIRIHSPFGDMHTAIDHVLDSFATDAPPLVMLAVKEHPLDSGLNDWRGFVTAAADRRGLADRIAFFEHGDLESLINDALGVVTVNSTSGTLALAAGKPVKVLGSAVYDMTDLTDQQPLASFWAAPRTPDAATWDAFCRVLGDRTLLHGAFLSDEGMDALIATAVERLTTDRVDP